MGDIDARISGERLARGGGGVWEGDLDEFSDLLSLISSMV